MDVHHSPKLPTTRKVQPMYAARILRDDNVMLIMPIPLKFNVTPGQIAASLERRLADQSRLTFIDVVELDEETAAEVTEAMEAQEQCTCDHHVTEVEVVAGDGIPWLYYGGTFAMLLMAFLILNRWHHRDAP